MRISNEYPFVLVHLTSKYYVSFRDERRRCFDSPSRLKTISVLQEAALSEEKIDSNAAR